MSTIADTQPSGREAAEAAPVPPERAIPLPVRLTYGFGSVAVAVKNAAFGYVLLYYNQVLGVPATIVSTAISLTLLIDAIVDPLIGRWSDMTRSRLGRRHPFIFAAAVPTALFFALIWFPPTGLSDLQMGIWLFVVAALTRASISAYEIASTAMAPELTSDYTQRTKLFSMRFWFGYAGTFAFVAFSLSIFFAPTPEFPVGQLNPSGYSKFAVAGSLLILCAILVCGFGTRGQIAHMRQADSKGPRLRLRDHMREMLHAFRNRGFLAIFGFGVCKFTAIGLAAATSIYFSTYVFGLMAREIAILAIDALVSATLAAPLAPIFSRLMGKRNTALIMSLVGIVIVTAPLWLTYFGMFFLPGDALLMPALFVLAAIGGAFIAISLINTTSMLADVVEDHAARSGRHQSGVFFAASGFMQQCSSGLGVFIAGLVLAASGFPGKIDPADVTQAMRESLLGHYLPAVVGLWAVGSLFLLFYNIDAGRHQRNLARLRERAAEAREEEERHGGVKAVTS